MDLKSIQGKIDSLKKPSSSGKEKYEKVDYEKIYFKPTEGKTQVRVLPSKFNSKMPFFEGKYYYGIAKYPIMALSNWGDADPIEEFIDHLKQTDASGNWELIKTLTPKIRISAPVVVRGEEEKGARLWQFGKLIYEQFLEYAVDEDYQDYEDVESGRDFTIDGKIDELNGRPYIKCSLRPKGKQTVLSTNASEVNSWLDNQPDILDTSINRQHSYEELKTILGNFLSAKKLLGDEEDEGDGQEAKSSIDFSKKTNFDDDVTDSKKDEVKALFNK